MVREDPGRLRRVDGALAPRLRGAATSRSIAASTPMKARSRRHAIRSTCVLHCTRPATGCDARARPEGRQADETRLRAAARPPAGRCDSTAGPAPARSAGRNSLEAGATRARARRPTAPPAAASPAPSCARRAARDCGARSRAGRPSRIGACATASTRLGSSSAGMTASATGTSASARWRAAARARANRGTRRRRGTRGRRAGRRRARRRARASRRCQALTACAAAPGLVRARRDELGHDGRAARRALAVEIPASPTLARARRIHGRGEHVRRVGPVVHDDRKLEIAQAHAARALLGFPVAGEGHHHGPRAAGDDVHDRVVAALRHRDERLPQQRREIDARPLDDGRGTGLAQQPLQPFVRNVGPGQHPPRQMAEARLRSAPRAPARGARSRPRRLPPTPPLPAARRLRRSRADRPGASTKPV